MKKTSSIILGIVLLVVALVCFSSDSLNGAVIGTIALMGALFAIRWADEH